MSETNMAYIYSALILRSVGKKIDEASLSDVLEAGGISVDPDRVKVLVETLNEVSIEDFMRTPTLPVVETPVVVKEEKRKKKAPEQPADDPATGIDFLFQ